MRFKSKTEAYSYIIFMLARLEDQLKPQVALNGAMLRQFNAIEQCMNDVKVAMENHEQHPMVVVEFLEHAKRFVSHEYLSMLTLLQEDLKLSDFLQTPQEKFENPLARRAES